MNRNRIKQLLYIFLIIGIGLLSRVNFSNKPEFITLYIGDILWALMVYLIIGFISNKISIFNCFIIGILISFSVEFSQMIHTPLLDSIRNNRFGALLLGQGFLWQDLVCYFIGNILGLFAEKKLRAKILI